MSSKLEQLFPAFLEIQDEQLRALSQKAMELAMERGGWTYENLHLCPVTLNWKNCDVSWIEHVTDVTKLCLMEFDALEKYYTRHGVPFRRDIVAAGALLHDIGKLTEFTIRDGTVAHGDNFELMRHPLSGALIAAQAGLPDTTPSKGTAPIRRPSPPLSGPSTCSSFKTQSPDWRSADPWSV